MLNFKISVSKDGKKYNIVFKAENEAIARERVHKEGYSILSIEEIFDKSEIGDTFVFEGYKSGELKHGKIVGNDIFKSYVKLRKDLEYDIIYIYSEKDDNISLEQKKKIIEELKEEYNIYYSSGKKDKIDDLRDKIKKDKEENKKLDNFYLKKELEDVNLLLEKVLSKLEGMIYGTSFIKLDTLLKDKLKIIYNEIIKLKKTTNISKLREIGELALLKIGKIELEELEKTKNKESRALLGETNKLLKKIGSKGQFIEKDRDIIYQSKYLLSSIKNIFYEIKLSRKKESIDKSTHSYVKNLLYLSKYRDFYKENTKLILKNFYKFIYNKELKDEIFLSRSVIKQNIVLLRAKEKGVNVSYTFLKKGISKFLDSLYNSLLTLSKAIFIIVVLYFIFFIFYFNFYLFFTIDYNNYDGIFYFIVILLLFLCIKIAKNILFIFINFVILFFIIIFGVINF